MSKEEEQSESEQENQLSESQEKQVCTFSWEKKQKSQDKNDGDGSRANELIRIQVFDSSPLKIKIQTINGVPLLKNEQVALISVPSNSIPQNSGQPNVNPKTRNSVPNSVSFSLDPLNLVSKTSAQINSISTLLNMDKSLNEELQNEPIEKLLPLQMNHRRRLPSLNKVVPLDMETTDSEKRSKSIVSQELQVVQVHSIDEPQGIEPFRPKSEIKSLVKRSNTNDFIVTWKNLSYTITKGWGDKQQVKNVLRNLNGYFKSGQVTALLGPSGAGKSTFIDCIRGIKNKGFEGEIRIKGIKKATIGLVPQHDYLLESLTVNESLVFAFKLRYGPKINWKKMTKEIIMKFKLDSVLHTTLSKCSGGQRKRVSIALEIIGQPNILILDEPTTGLDTPSCNQVIQMLKDLTMSDKPTAVLATIHQPSVKIFNSFDQVYVLSKFGQCIYNGSPADIIGYLSEVGLSCPVCSSSSDYIIEVASGDFGKEAINKLIVKNQHQNIEFFTNIHSDEDSIKFIDSIQNYKQKHPFFYHIIILLKRTLVVNYRNIRVLFIKFLIMLYLGIIIAIIFGDEVGQMSGCPPSIEEVYVTSPLKLSMRFERNTVKMQENIALLFICMMIGLISSVTSMLTSFPLEMLCFIKEYRNGWYSCMTYYLAKTIAEIPHQLVVPSVFAFIVYPLTGQPISLYRELGFYIINVILAFTGQAMGQCISAIWCHDLNAAAFVGGMITLPMVIFGGLLVRISRMPSYFRPFSWGSFIRFAFEAVIIDVYGFNRCTYEQMKIIEQIGSNYTSLKQPRWIKYLPVLVGALDAAKEQKNGPKLVNEEGLTGDYEYDDGDPSYAIKQLFYVFGKGVMPEGTKLEPNKSILLGYLELSDDNIYRSIYMSLFYVLLFQILTYLTLRWKLKVNK